MDTPKIIFVSCVFLNLVACGGSSDSGEYSHAQIANTFVKTLNLQTPLSVELVKADTLQGNFIVVRDNDYDSFDAYNLSEYELGSDIFSYLDNNYTTFYDLEDQLDTTLDEVVYRDPNTGIQFSKTRMTPSDLVKAQELIDGVKLKKATDQLIVQFGLPPKRAQKVAILGLEMTNFDITRMTTYQLDQYSKAILGSTMTEIKLALPSNQFEDSVAINTIYDKTAATNSISKAKVKNLVDLFIKNQ